MRFAALCLALQICVAAPRIYPATGLVLAIDGAHESITISHGAIAGFMDAMAMPFHVRSAKVLDGIHTGDSVAFTLVVDRDSSWVEEIRVVRFTSAERDPALAERLRLMGTQSLVLAIGEKVPDFSLTDQEGRKVSLSSFAGQVVAIDFIYTRCPLPDYCFRLSSHFARLQKRFADVVLLSVSFDPVHDGPAELARYAGIWKADPRRWLFLTGSAAEVQRVCGLFGVEYWPDEGVFTHSLHTAVLDREGRLVANLEGNTFTALQLGDLVKTVLRR